MSLYSWTATQGKRWLGTFPGAVAFIIIPALWRDYLLPKAFGVKTVSRHCGEHPWWSLVGVGVLLGHFNFARIRRWAAATFGG